VDLHKPKPWRGSREFAKEIGTIVIGVLIALGAEQAVEWAHRQQEAAEARKALHGEIADNARLMKVRLEEAPCMMARFDSIAAWVKGGGASPRMDSEDLGFLSSSAWDEAKVGAVSHMPLDERIAYDRFYAAAADSNEVIRAARNVFGEVARFAGAAAVPADEKAQAIEDITRAKVQVYLLAGYDRQILDKAKSMGISPSPYRAQDVENSAQLCDRSPSAPVSG
jgi:hypothetical protein